MSATLNADMFQKYYQNAPIIHIPGFTYPVERHYLNLENCQKWQLVSPNDEKSTSNLTFSKEPITSSIVISNLIRWIHKNKPEGAILCFLPGWQDIITVEQELRNSDPYIKIAIAHSKLDTAIQSNIFHHPPPGYRKVVLATNVAETSITIDDVGYVVDTGCHKETRFNAKENIVSLDNHWIAKANVNQRAGRAGRTKPGESYHLYSEERYNQMPDYSLPEILRKPLEQILLTCKIYSTEKSEQLMSHLPEPPDPHNIRLAIKDLRQMDIFDADENLTSLGKRIAFMQLHPKLAKALVESVIFRCALPMANIVSLLSTPERNIFENAMSNTTKETIRNLKFEQSPFSDHISLSNIVNNYWAQTQNHWDRRINRYSQRNDSLHEKNLKYIYSVREQMMNLLYANRLFADDTSWDNVMDPVNKFAHSEEYVKGVLFSGLGNLLIHKLSKGKQRLFTEQGQVSTIVKESVNSGLKEPPTSFMTYFDATTSLQRRLTSVRDSSVISPLSVILFRRGSADILNKVDVGDKIPLEGNQVVISLKHEATKYNIVVDNIKEAELLLKLRNTISELNQFFISHMGHPTTSQNQELANQIDDFWVKFLDGVSQVYTHFGDKINEFKHKKRKN